MNIKISEIKNILLNNINNNNPCGNNIRYTETYLDIMSKINSKQDQTFNEIEYENILNCLIKIHAEKTKDIQIMCWIIECLASIYSFRGIICGLEVLYFFILNFWNEINPKINEDFDISFRLVSIEWLNTHLAKKLSLIIKIDKTSMYDMQEIVNQNDIEDIFDIFELKENKLIKEKQNIEDILNILNNIQLHFSTIHNINISLDNITQKFRMFFELIDTIINSLQNFKQKDKEINYENNVIIKAEEDYIKEIILLSEELIKINPENLIAKAVIKVQKLQSLKFEEYIKLDSSNEIMNFTKFLLDDNI